MVLHLYPSRRLFKTPFPARRHHKLIPTIGRKRKEHLHININKKRSLRLRPKWYFEVKCVEVEFKNSTVDVPRKMDCARASRGVSANTSFSRVTPPLVKLVACLDYACCPRFIGAGGAFASKFGRNVFFFRLRPALSLFFRATRSCVISANNLDWDKNKKYSQAPLLHCCPVV